MDREGLGNRIKAIRGKDSRPVFAKRFGVSVDTVIRYENAQTFPGADFIYKLCNYYNVSADWIIGGEEPKTLLATQENVDSKGDINNQNLHIPLVEAELSAGGGSFLDSKNVIKYIEINPEIIKYQIKVKEMAFMRVYGDSMEPTIAHKDLVLINFSQIIPYSGGVFAVAHDYSVYIKRLTAEPGKLILRSDNKTYSDIAIDLKDETALEMFKIIGRAVWWCHDERL